MHDFVVVGAGSAGSVVASRLSEDPGTRVLLLEAGSGRIPRESQIPAAFSKLFKTQYDWHYRTAPEGELANRALYWPRGRMLGGSSAMNAMIWTPPAREDLDGWEAAGCRHWSWTDLEPALARAERTTGTPRAAGEVGIDVAHPAVLNPVTEALLAAALASGIPANDGFRAGRMDGAGRFRVTQAGGKRVSSATGYLDPVRHRTNLTIIPNATVDQVVFDGRRATGVRYRVAGAGAEKATGRVILAAGAIGSPHLLLRSGIGPAPLLAAHRIPVVADLPGVGKNLQDHLSIGVMYQCREPVTLAGAERIGNVLRYLIRRDGPLTSNVAEAGAFIRLGRDADRPDLELIFAPSYFVDHGLGNPPGHGFTVAAILLRPRSRGEVTLASADPLHPPVIVANYLTTGPDLELLEAGLVQARAIAARADVDRFRGPEYLPGPTENLERFIRTRAETLYHPVGTCRMGVGPETVVGDRLAVHETDDLWVVDGSIMPEIVSGHPHAAIVMIAERAAEFIRGGG